MLTNPLTKRQLGIMISVFGLLAFIAIFLFDSFGTSDPDAGFGPSQQLALVGSVLLILLGFTLYPLGDTPA